MQTTIKEFSNRLISERKRLGLTQPEFAEACGIKAASQFLYEKGKRTPNAEYLLNAKALGVHMGYLFGEETPEAIPITQDMAASAYIECDLQCRDKEGRLLDLEYRVKMFRELIDTNTSIAKERLKSNG